MFRLTSKVKIAAGIAAGALTLGAAGAYAAQNLPQTITTPTISTLGATNTTQLNLVSLNNAPKLTALPASALKDPGACVSYFATNRNYALVPQGYTTGSITISKANYHGKLMSGLNAWCKAQIKAQSTTSTATTTETETPDVTQSAAPSTDSTDSNGSQGALHGQGHANGHGKHANETD
jgi:hypothetical protein